MMPPSKNRRSLADGDNLISNHPSPDSILQAGYESGAEMGFELRPCIFLATT
jgi:hypothetical protein